MWLTVLEIVGIRGILGFHNCFLDTCSWNELCTSFYKVVQELIVADYLVTFPNRLELQRGGELDNRAIATFSATCCGNCSFVNLFKLFKRNSSVFTQFEIFTPFPAPNIHSASTINVITGWKVFEEAKLIRFPSLFCLSISLFINVEKISNQLQFKELVSIFQSKIS